MSDGGIVINKAMKTLEAKSSFILKIHKWVKMQLRLSSLRALVRETERLGLYED